MINFIPFLICLAGAVAYALSNNGKVQALALHCFWVGLLVGLLPYGGRLLR